MKPAALAAWLAALAVCAPMGQAHGTHSPYAAPGEVWQLIELDGAPFSASATLEFPEIGQLVGNAPCNRYRAEMWAAYPWFKLDNIAATRRACPDLALETRFFDTLKSMNLSEADGDVLILTGDGRRSMVFRRAATSD